MEFLACSSFKNCLHDPTPAGGLLWVMGSQILVSMWEFCLAFTSTLILKELGLCFALVSSLPETKILHLNILPGILLSCHLPIDFSHVCLNLGIFSCFAHLLGYLINVELHWYYLHWLPLFSLISGYYFIWYLVITNAQKGFSVRIAFCGGHMFSVLTSVLCGCFFYNLSNKMAPAFCCN